MAIICRWARPDSSRSQYLENQASESFENGVDRLDVICSVRIECKNSTLGAEIPTFSEVQKGAGLPFPATAITNMQTIFLYDPRNTFVPGNFGPPCNLRVATNAKIDPNPIKETYRFNSMAHAEHTGHFCLGRLH